MSDRTPARIAAYRAPSASGHQNSPPGLSSWLTPLSGRRMATGPFAAFAFSAMIRPSSAFSSGVVRISVTVGFQ